MGKAADQALLGRTIAGKFAIESFIGSGAMGQVYRARQVALDKTVAVKVLHSELASDETFARRFQREAQAASKLDHPNSMRVIDFGQEPDGLLYIAMEYLDGRDLLRVILDEWPLSGGRIANIIMQALAALAVAHDQGIVHRDLKPENIMILRGTDDEGHPTDIVKVCDFGIAKITARTTKDTGGGVKGALTTQGLVVGTPEYMSPEQGKGEALDPRSDLYSTGVILFQLLTGRVPFEAESALGVVLKHVTEEPPPPSSINPAIDLRLEAICLKAMRKPKGERYQSAREMRGALRRVLEDAGVRATIASSSEIEIAPVTGNAATVQAGVPRFDSAPAAARSDRGPLSTGSGTPSGTTALAEPVLVKPLWRTLTPMALFVALGGLAVVVGVRAAQSPEPTAPSSSPPSTVAESALPAGSGTAPVAAGVESSSPPPAVSSIAPVAATEPLKHAVAPASPPPRPNPPPEAAPAEGPPFDLNTAAADPRIVHSQGVDTRSFRKALPTWQFTQCYRDALKKSGKRLEGTLSLHLTFMPDGKFGTLLSGPDPIPAVVGPCINNALDGLPVHDFAPTGGTADVEVSLQPN